MIEFLAIAFFSKKIRAIAEQKKHQGIQMDLEVYPYLVWGRNRNSSTLPNLNRR